jgi:hypothetical protein
MKSYLFVVMIACVAPRVAVSQEQVVPHLPVLVGIDGGPADACPTIGRILGGDGGVVEVRTAPDGEVIATIATGSIVYFCDYRGTSIGIVYSGGQETECGVSTALEGPARIYDGPCHSGWVDTAYAAPAAG